MAAGSDAVRTRISAAIAARTYLAMAGRSALPVRPDQAAVAFFTALLGADALGLRDEVVALATGLGIWAVGLVSCA